MVATKVQRQIINPPTATSTLTDAGLILWDVSTDPHAKVIIAGNRSLTAPSNPVHGQIYILEVIQDATGGRTITWPSTIKFNNGVEPTLALLPSERDTFYLYFDGTNFRAMLYDEISNFASYSGNVMFIYDDGYDYLIAIDSGSWERMPDIGGIQGGQTAPALHSCELSPDKSQVLLSGFSWEDGIQVSNLFDVGAVNPTTGIDITSAATGPEHFGGGFTGMGSWKWSPDGNYAIGCKPSIFAVWYIYETATWTIVGAFPAEQQSLFAPGLGSGWLSSVEWSLDSTKIYISGYNSGAVTLYQFTLATIITDYIAQGYSGHADADWSTVHTAGPVGGVRGISLIKSDAEFIFHDSADTEAHVYNAVTGAYISDMSAYGEAMGVIYDVSGTEDHTSWVALSGQNGDDAIVQVFNATTLASVSITLFEDFVDGDGNRGNGWKVEFSSDNDFMAVAWFPSYPGTQAFLDVFRTVNWTTVNLNEGVVPGGLSVGIGFNH